MGLRASGIDVGLINKATLNILDEETTKKVGSTGFALVVEPLSSKTGLGAKYGFWLAKLGLPKMPVFDNIGINKGGEGGLWEHAYEQGYDSASIQATVKKLVRICQGWARSLWRLVGWRRISSRCVNAFFFS